MSVREVGEDISNTQKTIADTYQSVKMDDGKRLKDLRDRKVRERDDFLQRANIDIERIDATLTSISNLETVVTEATKHEPYDIKFEEFLGFRDRLHEIHENILKIRSESKLIGNIEKPAVARGTEPEPTENNIRRSRQYKKTVDLEEEALGLIKQRSGQIGVKEIVETLGAKRYRVDYIISALENRGVIRTSKSPQDNRLKILNYNVTQPTETRMPDVGKETADKNQTEAAAENPTNTYDDKKTTAQQRTLNVHTRLDTDGWLGGMEKDEGKKKLLTMGSKGISILLARQGTADIYRISKATKLDKPAVSNTLKVFEGLGILNGREISEEGRRLIEQYESLGSTERIAFNMGRVPKPIKLICELTGFDPDQVMKSLDELEGYVKVEGHGYALSDAALSKVTSYRGKFRSDFANNMQPRINGETEGRNISIFRPENFGFISIHDMYARNYKLGTAFKKYIDLATSKNPSIDVSALNEAVQKLRENWDYEEFYSRIGAASGSQGAPRQSVQRPSNSSNNGRNNLKRRVLYSSMPR